MSDLDIALDEVQVRVRRAAEKAWDALGELAKIREQIDQLRGSRPQPVERIYRGRPVDPSVA